ncbi:MAG TPA: ABC transporter ATP-binding protein [Acidimicrobiales bacterium]|nr:ABC transporter ATP-binding protein [Acidimicrobiales bacterium]
MAEEPGLLVSGVSKSYRSNGARVPALDGMSLEVTRGRFVTLIGPSGCGKSTLLHMLAGIERPDSGNISVFGESVDNARQAKHIGYVPQSLALLPWRTVLENARLPLELSRSANDQSGSQKRDPMDVLSALGLGDALDRYPAQLSGGMRQRVAIARAFVHEPAVLLMDEPFSAVDELTSEVLRRELIELWQSQRTTVVFVSHSVPEAVLLSDLVVVMTRAPGKAAAVIEVPLARPRGTLVEVTTEFREIEREIRLALLAVNNPERDR